jgi:hypothetical protein
MGQLGGAMKFEPFKPLKACLPDHPDVTAMNEAMEYVRKLYSQNSEPDWQDIERAYVDGWRKGAAYVEEKFRSKPKGEK